MSTTIRPIKACSECGASYDIEQWQQLTSARFIWPIDTRVCACGAEVKLDLGALDTIDSALPIGREKFHRLVESIREKNAPPEQTPPEQTPPEQTPPEQPIPEPTPQAIRPIHILPAGEPIVILYVSIPTGPAERIFDAIAEAVERSVELFGATEAPAILRELFAMVERARTGDKQKEQKP